MPGHDDHRDAHLLSLRLALGSIVAPKRPPYGRSSTSSSGTASPALPHPSPITSLSAATPSPSPLHSHSRVPSRAEPAVVTIPMAQSATMATSEPQVPAAVVREGGSATATSGQRTDFIGTLQSKSAWEALIHGSWV